MSLLDNGPHTATITTFRVPEADDEYGDRTPVPDKTFVVQNCSFRPLEADEIVAYGGKMVNTTYQVTHRDWPGGPYSIVQWGDLVFKQVGDTLISSRGRRTKHTKAFLQASTASVR
jgi:hypothetical protein